MYAISCTITPSGTHGKQALESPFGQTHTYLKSFTVTPDRKKKASIINTPGLHTYPFGTVISDTNGTHPKMHSFTDS